MDHHGSFRVEHLVDLDGQRERIELLSLRSLLPGIRSVVLRVLAKIADRKTRMADSNL